MSKEEEWHHRSLGHAEYDARCDICQAQRGIGRHLGETGTAEVHFDFAIFPSVVENRREGKVVSEQREKVRVLVGHGPEGEIFTRVVENTEKKKKVLPHLVLVLERVGRRNPYLQVRTDGKMPLEKLVGMQ